MKSEQAIPASSPEVCMQTYVNAMQPGWNLGNSLDATGPDETAWGNPIVTETLIQQIAAQGFKLDALRHSIVSLNDPNLIATVHYYGYWPFSVNIAGKTKFDMDSINDIHTTLDAVYNTLVANGIPVVIGEYGLLGFDKRLDTVEHGEILKFFEYYLQYAWSKNMASMLWDNGQHRELRLT